MILAPNGDGDGRRLTASQQRRSAFGEVSRRGAIQTQKPSHSEHRLKREKELKTNRERPPDPLNSAQRRETATGSDRLMLMLMRSELRLKLGVWARSLIGVCTNPRRRIRKNERHLVSSAHRRLPKTHMPRRKNQIDSLKKVGEKKVRTLYTGGFGEIAHCPYELGRDGRPML